MDLATAPDLIFHNADIYTADFNLPRAQAVAIKDGVISALGSDDEVKGLVDSKTIHVDADGRTLLPGLCDAHIHLLQWALSRNEVNLVDTRSRDELLERIGAAADDQPDDSWLIGRGWNESSWPDPRFPTAGEVDRQVGERPALLYRSDMHAAVASSEALRHAGIGETTLNPPGGVIDRHADGSPTGVLREHAIGLVSQHVPEPEARQIDQALEDGMAQLHRLGITAVHDQRMGADTRHSLAAYGRLERSGRLLLRINCNISADDLAHVEGLGLPTRLGSDRLRIGHVKLFSDGSLGSRTAWMLDPFEPVAGEGDPGSGLNVVPVASMADIFRRAVAAGFPISVHAIGDRAIRTCLDLFEEIAPSRSSGGVPHRIEHVQTIHRDDISRLGSMGITASVQPLHLLDDRVLADRYLGDRGATTYAFRSLKDAGVLLALGSDAPVASPNPFLGVHAALTRRTWDGFGDPWYPEQRLQLEEILNGYTIDAARAGGWDDVIGSLTPGKRADAVLLDGNLFAFSPEEMSEGALAQVEPLLTVFDGEVVYTKK